MGNSLHRRSSAKVMTLSGETMKFRTPIKVRDIVDGYPGHVLLESEAVKHYGTRAKPLESDQELVSKRLYFLVELPKLPAERNPRKVRSGINMTAKDRLENLKLARRSSSDLTILNAGGSSGTPSDESGNGMEGREDGNIKKRVKLRLPKAEVERVMADSKDGTEAAAKIVELCIRRNVQSGVPDEAMAIVTRDQLRRQDHGRLTEASLNWRHGRRGGEKKVSFMPMMETTIEAVAC